jgi:hypothetical protein
MSEGTNKDSFEHFEKMLNEYFASLMKNLNKEQKPMEEKNNDNNMVWFSASPKDYEFFSAPQNFWPGDKTVDPANQSQISPDLQDFLANAGTLLYDALYMPFRNRTGRLADFFVWVERARDRMEQSDFNDTDRQAFAAWCQTIADVLLKAQNKHGLWLTDSEEDLVSVMSEDIFEGNTDE